MWIESKREGTGNVNETELFHVRKCERRSRECDGNTSVVFTWHIDATETLVCVFVCQSLSQYQVVEQSGNNKVSFANIVSNFTNKQLRLYQQ